MGKVKERSEHEGGLPAITFIDADRIIAPLERSGPGFWIASAGLLAIIAWAVFAYCYQLKWGLGVTGMNRPVYWGVYMANFVFFIGISHAGTLISAILRIFNAEWRRPLTRCAEVITVLALIFGALSVIIDLGRPDRILNVIKYGRLQSPILWDVFCISTYLTFSILYLYFPMVPDLAILRDRGTRWHRLYRFLALGYTGTPAQRARLEFLINFFAILIIPIAVSVHTVVSYVFATTLQPGWHSTIFGPYFVAGAIFSGIAVLLLCMATIRKSLGLERVMKAVHFNNLSLVLLGMTIVMIYFTFNIFLVEVTGAEPVVMRAVWEKMSGRYFLVFWGMILGCFILPAVILSFPKGRSITGCVVASLLIVGGMWIERFLIVVPTLVHPRMPWARGIYYPTWVEWSITLGCFAAFAYLYLLFAKLFPIVSLWEVQEGADRAVQEVSERLEGYMPEPAASAAS